MTKLVVIFSGLPVNNEKMLLTTKNHHESLQVIVFDLIDFAPDRCAALTDSYCICC